MPVDDIESIQTLAAVMVLELYRQDEYIGDVSDGALTSIIISGPIDIVSFASALFHQIGKPDLSKTYPPLLARELQASAEQLFRFPRVQ